MSFETLIITYGYPILFLGTLLEGETIVAVAGFLAHRGYLSLPWVIAVSFIGTFISDQCFFVLGRTKGSTFVAARPNWQTRVQKVQPLLRRYGLWIVLGFRFLYGLRTVIPLAIGISGFPHGRFVLLNALGGLIWAAAIAYAGYVFGHAIETLVADVRRYELLIILVVTVVTGGFWIFRYLRRRNLPMDDRVDDSL